MNVKTWISALWHGIKMACSRDYRTGYMTAAVVDQIQSEIDRCHHAPCNLELLWSLVEQLQAINPNQFSDVLQRLVRVNNFDCKAYAIELNPEAGKTCADQLMETARHNLEHYGHGDHATWARKKLILARKWYQIAGSLTQDLADEINAGLDRTKWVLAMWPDYMEIVDPEGH